MAKERIAIRELVIKKWKNGVLGIGIGLCLAAMSSTDCFAAALINDGFQRLEAAGWEEEFTDTDTRRGILAVRGDVFQGFGGGIQIRLKELESGRETSISFNGGADYIMNQELRPGKYEVLSLEADSEGRKFDCHMDPEEIEVKDDQITLCRIFVTAGSVYQVPFEDEIEIREERQQIETELTMEQGVEKAEEKTKTLSTDIEEGHSVADGYLEEHKKIPFIFLIAGLGIAVSMQGGMYVMKGRKKE